jgi:8-oxo-dGTP pyrophosphatase MutT (NUDIX family)
MSKPYLWELLGSEWVFEAWDYRVRRDRVRDPLGRETDYFVLDHKHPAVSIVPVDESGRVLLVQQWRHTVQKLLWSTPAGGIEDGETPEAAAARELREETGCASNRIEPLYWAHPSVGIAKQTYHIFIAHNARQTCERDPGEIHDIRWFTRDEIRAMIRKNEMIDALGLMSLTLWLLDL